MVEQAFVDSGSCKGVLIQDHKKEEINALPIWLTLFNITGHLLGLRAQPWTPICNYKIKSVQIFSLSSLLNLSPSFTKQFTSFAIVSEMSKSHLE